MLRKIIYVIRFLINSIKINIIKLLKNNRIIFLCMAPLHGNLGDHAITQAEKQFLQKYFNSYYIYEIPSYLLSNKRRIKNISKNMNNNIIFINGGGFLGTLWFEGEEKRLRFLLDYTHNCYVNIFPQTIYYEDSEWGRKELENSKEIYNRHPHLKIFTREKTSYNFAKEIYNDVELIPDMVLSLKINCKTFDRKGALLCLRNDLEKTIKDEDRAIIEKELINLFDGDVKTTDTVVNYGIKPRRRERELDKKLDEFRRCKVVVTDRLHGMVFAALTGTPCVVVNSKSPKIKGCYEWIKELEYVKFADNISDFPNVLNEVLKIRDCVYKYNLEDYYKHMADIIRSEM